MSTYETTEMVVDYLVLKLWLTSGIIGNFLAVSVLKVVHLIETYDNR